VFDFVKLDWLNGKYLRELSPQGVRRTRGWNGAASRNGSRHGVAGASARRTAQRSRPLLAFFLPAVSTSPKRNCSRDRSSTKTDAPGASARDVGFGCIANV